MLFIVFQSCIKYLFSKTSFVLRFKSRNLAQLFFFPPRPIFVLCVRPLQKKKKLAGIFVFVHKPVLFGIWNRNKRTSRLWLCLWQVLCPKKQKFEPKLFIIWPNKTMKTYLGTVSVFLVSLLLFLFEIVCLPTPGRWKVHHQNCFNRGRLCNLRVQMLLRSNRWDRLTRLGPVPMLHPNPHGVLIFGVI